MLQKLFINALLATGLASALTLPRQASVWKPSQGIKWQINLESALTSSASVPDAEVWDLDLFNTPNKTITDFRSSGKKVICYFSAGTTEPNRPDLSGLPQSERGNAMIEWPDENWLNIRSEIVWNIMKERIRMAKEKGCDAIDPDNIGKLLTSINLLEIQYQKHFHIHAANSFRWVSKGK
jgi:hypothetical protein